MQTVNVHAAKTHFSRLVDRAAAGEEIIIAKGGKPIAKLVPLTSRHDRPKRRLGAWQALPRFLPISMPRFRIHVIDTFEGR
jgi:prevent-host-death family protein